MKTTTVETTSIVYQKFSLGAVEWLVAWLCVCVCVRAFLSSHSLNFEWVWVCVYVFFFSFAVSASYVHLHMQTYTKNTYTHNTWNVYIIWFLRLPIEKETRINASTYFSQSCGTVLLASSTSLLHQVLPLTLQHFSCTIVCVCERSSFERLKESLIKA